jgi:hexosaminidase
MAMDSLVFERKSILGVEAPLWSETVTNLEEIEFMTFPRLPAIAEIAWTPTANRNWESFSKRIAAHGKRWELMGVNYYKSPKVNWSGEVK